jgi:DNA-directed RNA polymerase subunit RPC12/RpoP
MTPQTTFWVRQCQECGHRQSMKSPAGQATDNWRNAKCRKCGSEALDYGSGGWSRAADGKFVQTAAEGE